jgi:hypothetical protein
MQLKNRPLQPWRAGLIFWAMAKTELMPTLDFKGKSFVDSMHRLMGD